MSRKPAERPEQEQLSLLANPKPKAPGQEAQEVETAPGPPASASTSIPSRQPESVEVPAPPPPQVPQQPRIYLVSELLKAARLTLESRFADVRVEGEVSGLKRSGNGHIYFTLKDADAQLECVMYSREASRLKFMLEEGMAVRCRGRLTIYEARGKFQMTVDKVEPTGAGALALAFEQLKQRLGAEGLFDPARKRPLPFLPRRIGVVTSPSGAVIRDIVRIAHRRFPIPILLAPTQVQGDGAALGIAAGIRRLEAIADVDVIIVARGGGSLEDLWAFNEEPVARAIFACRVPVISAVGHETDFTIADFVADLRAPTPSAAAERAVPVRDDLTAELGLLRRRGGRALAEAARRARHELERARARLGDPRRLLDERRQRLDEQIERARRVLARRTSGARADLRGVEGRLHRAHPHRRIAEQRHALAAMRHRLEVAMQPALVRRRHAIEAAGGKLEALSPMRVLERGFSLTQRADGHVVTSAGDVRAGDRITVRVHDGGIDATVDGTKKS
ncbi:MAG TPA: exodeoxyribonuclease VII large subunit [Polyangia bacterium]|nr:exodeoxyribonuclease VII large subunit [Polyangia bacterium]